MKLSEEQRLFTQRIGMLIDWAYLNGYELTFGDCYRDPRCPYGIAASKHKKRLAVDFNLFINGKYQQSSAAHEPMGEYWESLGGVWGGRWAKKDGNHYEAPDNPNAWTPIEEIDESNGNYTVRLKSSAPIWVVE